MGTKLSNENYAGFSRIDDLQRSRFKSRAIFLILPLFLLLPVASFAAPAISKISCGGTSFTGPLSKACSVYLTTAATSTTYVSLSSNSSAIWVPSSVPVYAGRITGGFSAYIYGVQSAQTATITGTSGGVSTALSITANPTTTAGLTLSASTLAFGNTVVNATATQYLTLTSAGTGALTISAASVSGSGFSISGVSFPITLSPGQSTSLPVRFTPGMAGAAAGTLSISSTAYGSPTKVVSLSGAGTSVVSTLVCASSSLVGPATSSCTVSLNSTAPTGGQTVSLSSNNTAASVPASVVVPAGASSAGFNANVATVTSSQAINLTASANGVSKSFALQVQASVPTLAVSSGSVAFGNVTLSKTVTAALTLTSTGSSAVTVDSVSVSGTGFSISGAAFPVTLSSAKSIALTVTFAPTAAGTATGQLTISSNSSTGSSTVVSLSGTGESATAGKTYYLAPQANGGKDSNSGLSPTQPWLSPNHPLNCGDVIIATPSTAYDSNNFNSGKWGTVSCANGNSVAWLKCATFDGCKIYSTRYGVYVDKSYWGVQGWEVSVSAPGNGFCFAAAPAYSNPVNVHHIVFANNVANGCIGGGIDTFNVGSASVDHFAAVGNIVYNAAQGSAQCYSGITVYQPAQTDWAPGTHIYIGGNFAWGNFQPNICGGVQAWGGDGIIFDTLDGSQGMPYSYLAQAVAENNITIGNGGHGIEVQNNVAGSTHAPVILANNTSWGNEANTNQQNNALCAEVLLNSAYNVEERNNLSATKSQKACVANPIYAYSAYTVNGTVSVHDNFAFAYPGLNSFVYNGPNYQFGSSNITGVDPYFPNASVPGKPSCDGTGSVPGCMAGVIANFAPGNSAAANYGYHVPTTTAVSNPLFPQWLCNANLPEGLVTMGCLAQ